MTAVKLHNPLFESEYILGVDPGFTGALAIIDAKLANSQIVEILDMPIAKSKNKAGKSKTNLVPQPICDFVALYASSIRLAVIEDVGAMPGQGVVSMFNFGFSTGMVHGIIASFNIPTVVVKPTVWKTLMGLSRDKQLSIDKASTLFPKHQFKFVKKDGRAEAALLAHFGRRIPTP